MSATSKEAHTGNASKAPAQTPHTPTLAAPSPLQIGKAFIKQYYQVLSTNPTQITKFYKSNSVISHSLLPSVPAQPKTLTDLTKQDGEGDQIFQWCRSKENKNGLCFDFGRGAIDAQETINGILLVVTGHIKLPVENKGDQEGMKKFVQTFFLNNGAAAGKKRQFYVHNDVLRFLDDGVDLSSASEESEGINARDDATESQLNGCETNILENTGPPPSNTVVPDDPSRKIGKIVETQNIESNIVKKVTEDEKVSTVKEVSVGGNIITDSYGKEGSKELLKKDNAGKTSEINAEGSVPSKSKALKSEDKKSSTKVSSSEKKVNDANSNNTNQEKKSRKNKSRGRSRKSRSSSPTDNDNVNKSKKTDAPGSWASLVAGGSGPSAVAAAAACAAAKISKEEKNTPAPAAVSNEGEQKETSNGKQKIESSKQIKNDPAISSDQQMKHQHQSNKKINVTAQRTPEATILIKNIPDRTKEGEIRRMFEPYATKLQQKILGITLLASRGFCFVDFDSKTVVDDIVKDVKLEEAAKSNEGKDRKEGQDTIHKIKFMLNGKPLDVGRKVPDKIGSGGRGRVFRRSASPGNSRGGGGYNKNNRNGGTRRSSPRGSNRPANKK